MNPGTRTSAGTILPTNSSDPTITNGPLPNERKNKSSTTLNGLKDALKDGNLSREITRSEETRRSSPVINEGTRQSWTSENISKRIQEWHSWDQSSRAGGTSLIPPIWGNSEKRIGKKVIFCDLRNGVVKIQPTNSINQTDGGVFVELPRLSQKAGRLFHTPVEQVIDLWKLLTPAMNARRMFSNIRYMWLTGDDRIRDSKVLATQLIPASSRDRVNSKIGSFI